MYFNNMEPNRHGTAGSRVSRRRGLARGSWRSGGRRASRSCACKAAVVPWDPRTHLASPCFALHHRMTTTTSRASWRITRVASIACCMLMHAARTNRFSNEVRRFGRTPPPSTARPVRFVGRPVGGGQAARGRTPRAHRDQGRKSRGLDKGRVTSTSPSMPGQRRAHGAQRRTGCCGCAWGRGKVDVLFRRDGWGPSLSRK